MDTKTILFNIKRIRELKGYCQLHMAECLDVSVKTYSRIENGESDLSINRLNKIAKTLHLSVNQIECFNPFEQNRTEQNRTLALCNTSLYSPQLIA